MKTAFGTAVGGGGGGGGVPIAAVCYLCHLATNSNLQVAQLWMQQAQDSKAHGRWLANERSKGQGVLYAQATCCSALWTSLQHRAKKDFVLYPKDRFQKFWGCHPNPWLGDPKSDPQSCSKIVYSKVNMQLQASGHFMTISDANLLGQFWWTLQQ